MATGRCAASATPSATTSALCARAGRPHAHSTLQRLVLEDVQATSEGARHICDALANQVTFSAIHTLVLDSNPVRRTARPNTCDTTQIGPDGGKLVGHLLKVETSLAVLKLNGCLLGDEGAVAVLLGLEVHAYNVRFSAGQGCWRTRRW